jgi:hypothetical protein
VAFAGHRPIHDATVGAAGESIRLTRPDVALLDLALPASVVSACVDAADEAGTELVLVSSTASPEELEQQAEVLQCLNFALPGGPLPMQRVLEAAAARRRKPAPLTGTIPADSVHPSMRAALAKVAMARSLGARAAAACERSATSVQMDQVLDEARRGRLALQAAVRDFAMQLKAAELPLERIVRIVQDTVADCATTVGAQAALPSLLGDSVEWVRSVYDTASPSAPAGWTKRSPRL